MHAHLIQNTHLHDGRRTMAVASDDKSATALYLSSLEGGLSNGGTLLPIPSANSSSSPLSAGGVSAVVTSNGCAVLMAWLLGMHKVLAGVMEDGRGGATLAGITVGRSSSSSELGCSNIHVAKTLIFCASTSPLYTVPVSD